MATYAIGDIQGCFTQLQTLLTHIHFNPHADHLWFAGDLVNRGPRSLETLRFIKNLPNPAKIVLGNHDLHLLAVVSGKAEQHQNDTLDSILQASDCKQLCDWLRQQKLLHHDPALGYVMVHAGLAPQWDLTTAQQCAIEVEQVLQSEQYPLFFEHMYGNQPDLWLPQLTGWERLRFITNCLTRMRFCDREGRLELTVKQNVNNAPADLMPWFTVPNRKNQSLQILFGHWAALQGQAIGKNIYPLDGGCVWGNCLIALRLEDGKRFQVPC